ncbi:MAG: hypothetical protein ABFD64_03800 [Armatimonadota bacterium]
MPKCKKCGASLHPEQKVCLACGTQTDRWPGGPKAEEEPPVQIPWLPIGIIAGGLVLAIVLFALAMHFRIAPPDEVANKWLLAVTSRDVKRAKEFTTPDFEAMLADRPMSAEKGDDYYDFMYNNDATYSVSKPRMESSLVAYVTVTFKGKNGQSLSENIRMELLNRKWKITLIE